MRRKLLTLEVFAWCAGLLCLTALLIFRVRAVGAEQASHRFMGLSQSSAEVPSPTSKQEPSQDLATYDGVIGRLEMPDLALSVPILNNYDPDSLRKGVGRIRGTGVPGGLGNFVVAGHRDTYFRPLRRVRAGMLMRVSTGEGTFDYRVDGTTIVLPEDVDVLDIGDRPEMTLITCYPFDYIGAAPKRFIVRAHLVSVAGESR